MVRSEMGPQRRSPTIGQVALVACCSLEVAGHQQAQERGKTIANVSNWLMAAISLGARILQLLPRWR